MQIEPINPEVIGQEDYQQTEIPNLFVHPGDGTLVIVGQGVAYLVKPAE